MPAIRHCRRWYASTHGGLCIDGPDGQTYELLKARALWIMSNFDALPTSRQQRMDCNRDTEKYFTGDGARWHAESHSPPVDANSRVPESEMPFSGTGAGKHNARLTLGKEVKTFFTCGCRGRAGTLFSIGPSYCFSLTASYYLGRI